MHNMLKEFYDFIAKRINSYFLEISAEETLQNGESFCLKLDDAETVQSVFDSLKELALKANNIGTYEYKCMDGSLYRTFTLKVVDNEVIIAAQINGMTNDFLCATLRNAANNAGKPLLMISSNLIDSAKSGSRDMTANGMPFYADNLITEIKKMTEESTQLSGLEKSILEYELKRRDEDVFSDKASLYEYKDLLSIMNNGSIEKENYPGFRLFFVDGKKDYQNEAKSKIDKKLKENHELFEKIDRSLRFGNVEKDLADDFEEGFLMRVEKSRREDPERWSLAFTYNELLAAMEKKQQKKENPLNIELNDISVYGEIPLHSFSINEKLLIRNEGSMKTKKRTRSMIIFNQDKFSKIHVCLECNVRVGNSDISSDDTSYVRDGKNLIFEFQREDISFHKIEIKDSVNNINYIFKICIVDIQAEYLIGTIKRNFIIEYKKNKKRCRIKLIGVGTDLIFNADSNINISKKLNDNTQYQCRYNERLHLYMAEEELSNYGSGIFIEINFSGIFVPFILYPDEMKSIEIVGRKIFKEKFSSKKSFQLGESNRFYKDSQEYHVKANLLKELWLEKCIINKSVLYGRCKKDYALEDNIIEIQELELPFALKQAYCELLEIFKENNTIPTLAYLTGTLKDAVERYLHEFNNLYAALQDGDNLNVQQENALLLGTLLVGNNDDEIMLTPFHPLNLAYQLELCGESEFEKISDVVLDRLNSVYLLPYIKHNKKIYKVSDQLYSMEWRYYAPVENRRYRGNRRYVPKLIEEKITEFISHFRYIFSDINNKKMRINLINMGDCRDVFAGIAQYFIHTISKFPDVDRLMKFEIHIYTDDFKSNVFNNIKEYVCLKKYLNACKLTFANGAAMSSLEGVFSKNIECYFHKDDGKKYEYAHISFYEMESEITSETATMNQIETGISIGGIISGVPSSKYGQKYRTGFGMKYAKRTSVVEFAEKYNSLVEVGNTGNPYYSGTSISTQIDKIAEDKIEYIYKKSNWVVFVDPKVDLEFFSEKEANNELLIIHYSDQYTSSSGYDAITVTYKSKQYSKVIQEYLKEKGIDATLHDVAKIINLFNAVNGDWLLRLVSSKKIIGAKKDTTFSREKISIVAAIKFMLAFLKHPDIIWVPISLEEMLRVSGAAGLSSTDGILSYKNLGFGKGPTSDDLLFIGLNYTSDQIKIYLYPTEVKTGVNTSDVIKKAFEQVLATAKGFQESMNPEENKQNTVMYKVNRNFLMQLFVTSCKKMKVYHVDDSQEWDYILDKFRSSLLNEEYIISTELEEILGKGAVLSFSQTAVSRKISLKENGINFLEMPECNEFNLILNNVEDIYIDIQNKKNEDNFPMYEKYMRNCMDKENDNPKNSELQKKIALSKKNSMDIQNEEMKENTLTIPKLQEQQSNDIEEQENIEAGMKILFGTNQQDGSNLIWKPNNTDILFHTNTGIIGTMGTGKTQFTKSLIAQLYRNQKQNIGDERLGILIFDYKGDYNESKQDFVEMTNATILKPYKLPFNPLALTRSKVFKPLLPIHTANAFKDTISKVYGLGAKQQNTLFRCIIESYEKCGIYRNNPESWNKEAPTFEQVYKIYMDDDSIKKNDSLAAAMNKLYEFNVFESEVSKTKSLFNILKGIVVIDLSGYDADIQSLIVAITLDLFYVQMQSSGSSKLDGKYRQLTKFILVDEADNFMSQGFSSLKKILKEGREFGVGTILSTQFLKHFGSGDDDYAKYILTWVVHNVADLKPSDVDFVFKTENKSVESQNLFNDIKKLQKHYSIVKIGSEKHQYIRDRAFWELYNDFKSI